MKKYWFLGLLTVLCAVFLVGCGDGGGVSTAGDGTKFSKNSDGTVVIDHTSRDSGKGKTGPIVIHQTPGKGKSW